MNSNRSLLTKFSFSLAALFMSACGGSNTPAQQAKPEATQAPQAEAKVEGGAAPAAQPTAQPAEKRRIVSIGAAITETVYAIGRGDEVVAVDRTSIYPEMTKDLPNVGLPHQLSVEGIAAQQPTLILADGDDTNPALEQLAKLNIKVERLGKEPRTVEAAAERIIAISTLLDLPGEGKALVERLKTDVQKALDIASTVTEKPKVLFVYARGHRTLLMAGKDTSAHELLLLAGAQNAMESESDFKPLNAEAIIAAGPEFIVIPEKGLQSLGGVDGVIGLPGIAETPAGKNKRIIPIDDLEILTFGPRMGQGLLKLVEALHGGKSE